MAKRSMITVSKYVKDVNASGEEEESFGRMQMDSLKRKGKAFELKMIRREKILSVN